MTVKPVQSVVGMRLELSLIEAQQLNDLLGTCAALATDQLQRGRAAMWSEAIANVLGHTNYSCTVLPDDDLVPSEAA